MNHGQLLITLHPGSQMVMENIRTGRSVRVGPGEYVFYWRSSPRSSGGKDWLVSRQIKPRQVIGMIGDNLLFYCNQNPITRWRDRHLTAEPYIANIIPFTRRPKQRKPAYVRPAYRRLVRA